MIESPKRPKIVGNFIRQRREALQLSQRALGLLFDPPVTTQFISNVERGVTPLPPAHVPTLTRALQVSESDMMALLEKEYIHKLSGRLGMDSASMQTTPSAVTAAIDAFGTLRAATHQTSGLSIGDHHFMNRLYQAYLLADAQTRQKFVGLCGSVLNVHPTNDAVDAISTETVAVAAAAVSRT